MNTTIQKVLILLVMLVTMLSGCGYCDIEFMKVRKEMKIYLEDKYKKEFVVKDLVLTGNEGFGYNTYIAKAYPKEKPDLIFRVGGNKKEPGKYKDEYLSEKWSMQGKAEVALLLKRIYGEEILMKYDFYVHYSVLQDPMQLEKLKKLNHSEVLALYDLDKTSYITCYVFVDQLDKKSEAEKAYQVFEEHMIKNKVKDPHLFIYFLSKNYKDRFLSIYKNYDRYEQEFKHDKLKKENKLINFVSIGSKVNDVSDVINRFEY